MMGKNHYCGASKAKEKAGNTQDVVGQF